MAKLNNHNLKKLLISAFLTILISGLTQSFGQNIAQWRGINRDGIYKETGLLNEWPEQGPELIWFTEEIGDGFASPVVFNDKVFVNGEENNKSFLFAFDVQGKLLWKAPNGKEFIGSGYSSNFPGARSTPTVIDNLIYASSGTGRIACFEASSGKEKWAVDMVKDLNGYQNEFGYSESLVVDNKSVYCFPGGKQTNIAALNRFTGETVWTSKALGDTTSFCSPILVNLPEHKILITCSRNFLFTIDCENGELLGSYKLEGFKYDGEHCNTPIYHNGYIYYVAADEEGKGTVKLKLASNGKIISEVWHNKQIRNAFGGFVVVNNKLFTTIKGNWLKGIDLNTGKVSDSVKVTDGSLIFADNKFICYGNNGRINLITYKQNKPEVASNLKIEKGSKQHFSHPVVANGVLYVRHGKALMAYRIN